MIYYLNVIYLLLKGSLLGLKPFLYAEILLKTMKNDFYFMTKALRSLHV